jgi:DNA-binding Xre family transcriptional regulator
VNSKLSVLVAERQIKSGKRLGIRTIATEAGASVSTVQRLLNNSIRRVPLDDLALLCKYFNCQVGDILVYSPDSPSDK